MNTPAAVRLDKWLWAVRIYKTRTVAADACRKGQLKVNGQTVKPSRDVHIGEIITKNADDITRTFKVLQLLDHRVGAQVAKEFVEDQTPASEFEKQREKVYAPPIFVRPKGVGRPTKKDRREMEKLI